MMLRQSTSAVISFGPFVDKTDGVTLETGLISAIDHTSTGIMLSKNGAAYAVRNGTPTASVYGAHGDYRVTLNTTDTNTLGRLRVIWTDPATCLAVWADFEVVPAVVYDALVLGTDQLDVTLGDTHPAATIAALTVTGALTVSNGIIVTASTSNRAAIAATGNGTGAGIIATSGSGATGNGISAVAASTAGHGISALGTTTGNGILTTGGSTGDGIQATGGANGHGIDATGVGTGSGINAAGGATGPGILATGGGNNAAADGIRAVSGGATATGLEIDRLEVTGTTALTGAVTAPAGITANLTGNITGTLATVTNLTNAPGNGDLTSTMKTSVTTAATAATPTVTLAAGQLVFKKNVARANFAFPMYDSTGALKTGLTVTAVIRKDAGSFAALAGSVTEIGSTGWYTVDWAQAETNADTIAFSAAAAGANPSCYTILTQQ